ncbi:FAD dependent oxidoreductase [Xylaria sp. FL0064]|nr:FAD dependent oxidoreductase [Xylaria sp. FL0064]
MPNAPMESGKPKPRRIVVVGGGIVGCCTAYYLTRHPSFNRGRDSITIVEASSIAAAASGKAGGLLALWASPRCNVPLSFRLHADLAAEHNGAQRWGYRRIHCARAHPVDLAVARAAGTFDSGAVPVTPPAEMVGSHRQDVIPNVPADLDWLYVENVMPYEFTTSMAKLAVERGANVVFGYVTSIDQEQPGPGRVVSVTYTPRDAYHQHQSRRIEATDVVLCAKPWARALHPAVPIKALRQSSVIIQPPRTLSAFMLFMEISLATSSSQRARHVTPEIFTRPNGTVWAAGDTDPHTPLPSTADEVLPDRAACDDILAHMSSVSQDLGHGSIVARQTCYLPNIEGDMDGPVLGETGIPGLWIAAGHSCWGIQNAPATGKLMAEFVFEGKTMSADVSELRMDIPPAPAPASP